MTERKPEFSRLVRVDSLKGGGSEYDIEASAAECERLARRLGVLAVDRLAANLRLWPEKNDLFRLQGTLEADVTQACVVSLAPVRAHISAFVERAFGTNVTPPEEREVVLSSEDEDLPVPIEGGVIDLGEAVAEQLALEIDPFPRASGVRFEGYSTEPGGGRDSGGPLAGLARWKKRRD